MVDESSFAEFKKTGQADGVFSASKPQQSPAKIDALAGKITSNLQLAPNKAQGVSDPTVDTQLDVEPSPYQTVRSYMYAFTPPSPLLRRHVLT
jgi:hypothetical protein